MKRTSTCAGLRRRCQVSLRAGLSEASLHMLKDWVIYIYMLYIYNSRIHIYMYTYISTFSYIHVYIVLSILGCCMRMDELQIQRVGFAGG